MFMLLTYSIGFAHNVIPHSHSDEVHEHETSGTEHSHHHHSVEHAHVDHEHVAHGDHYDEGLYDLFLCFLHEAEHQEDDCDVHYFIPTKSNRVLNKVQSNLLVAVMFSLVNETDAYTAPADFEINLAESYRAPSIVDIPLRGPPVKA